MSFDLPPAYEQQQVAVAEPCCELEAVNPFAHLTALQRHADAVAEKPAAWFPWTYHDAPAATAAAMA